LIDVTATPIEQFPLRWRLTDPLYRVLPPRDLARIRPLDADSAKRLIEVTEPWYWEQPFTQGWFGVIAATSIGGNSPEAVRRVRKWLFQRGIPFRREVYLSWDNTAAAITTWEMVVKYWDDLWYPSSDDLVVFDSSLSWALFFWHEEEAFFASHPVKRRSDADRDGRGFAGRQEI
jgi:hypothetical protein